LSKRILFDEKDVVNFLSKLAEARKYTNGNLSNPKKVPRTKTIHTLIQRSTDFKIFCQKHQKKTL